MVNSLSACGNTGNEYGVVILFGGGGDTPPLFFIIEIIWTCCNRWWWGAKKKFFWSCNLHEHSCTPARALVQGCTSACAARALVHIARPEKNFFCSPPQAAKIFPFRNRHMWQGVGTCGMGGGRVWGHVAGCGACGRGLGT